jgi:DUF971 family protein
MDDRTVVTDVTVEREEGVTLVFGDGHVCRFALDDLRRHCPCASCRNDREAGREPWPRPGSPLPLTVTDAELTGAWGIRFVWNDRHGTGIYPWGLLREWCDTGGRSLRPDSGLGGP